MKVFQIIDLLPRLTPGHQQQVMKAVWGNLSKQGQQRLLGFHSRYSRSKDTIEFRQRLVEELIAVIKSEIEGVGKAIREAEKLKPLAWNTMVNLEEIDNAATKELEAIYNNTPHHPNG